MSYFSDAVVQSQFFLKITKMVGKVFVLVAAILLVQSSTARVIREAEKPSSQELTIKDIADNIVKGLDTLKKTAYDAVGAKNEDEFKTIVSTETKNYVKKLDDLSKDLQVKVKETVNDLEKNELVKDLKTRVDTAIETLKKEQPGVTGTVEQLNTNFQNSVNGIVTEARKLADSPKAAELQNDLKNIATALLNATSEVVNDVKNQITAEKKD